MDWAKCLSFIILLSFDDFLVGVGANSYYYNGANNNNRMYQNRQMDNTRSRIRPPQVNSIGFVGGPDGDVVIRSMYLLYRRFLAVMVFKQGQ